MKLFLLHIMEYVCIVCGMYVCVYILGLCMDGGEGIVSFSYLLID